jgi:hypothetical protein
MVPHAGTRTTASTWCRRFPGDSVIPSGPAGTSPITHVIYVMKENRTYDRVLGDLDRGNSRWKVD